MNVEKNMLVLMRHGQSIWNLMNRFTGWVDVPLSEDGISEAISAAKLIKDLAIDRVYTSTLNRAIHTALIVLSGQVNPKSPVLLHPGAGKLESWAQIYEEKMWEQIIPVICAWQLNERHYGKLQGLNKKETVEKFGKEQVKKWRRSYQISPPGGESLKSTGQRAYPYFKKEIFPRLDRESILVSAHGNSLRSILMELESLSEEEVVRLEIPTGQPILYEFSGGRLFRRLL
jgi:2,3-bisphosphoglycerate-dependent phosphoglycerate mutase